jgi:DNA-binding MarR family transcriptional regulator
VRHSDSLHALLHESRELGHEARLQVDDHATLKLWLRMLTCTTQIQDEIRRRLRAEFDITLARFDYLAQLYRFPDGLRMSELSRHLMVTGGNITALTDDLEADKLVLRESSPTDRRAWIVRLTPRGRQQFARMAQRHKLWLREIFKGLDDDLIQQLLSQLGTLRLQLTNLQPPTAKKAS